MTDVELLRRAADGDQQAFAQLHRRHEGACRRRARHVLAGEEWVDDVLQAVFLDVWLLAGRFDAARGSARSWLLGLTHFKAVDVVRAQERHVARSARETLLADRYRCEPSAEDVVAADEERHALHAALSLLPRAQRDAVALCFVAGHSQADAARLLGIPLGTVKSRSHSGVLRLRLLLGAPAPAPAPAVVPALQAGGA